MPFHLPLRRTAAGFMAAGNDECGAVVFCWDIVQVVVRRANLYRQAIAWLVEDRFGQGSEDLVCVDADAIVARMAAPSRFADDVALVAHDGFGKLDDSRSVDHGKEGAVAIEDALVVLVDAHMVEAEGPQPIKGSP